MNKNTKNRQLREKSKPQSLGEGKFLVGSNPKRNMAEFVYHNEGADGKKFSITRHEPLDPKKVFKAFKARKTKNIAGATVEVQ